MKTSLKKGFTLVEMLVVVLIIALLMGVGYRILGFGRNVQERAVTKTRMEQLCHAIEEYHAEYGQYPPVNRRHVWNDSIDYLLPDSATLSPGFFNVSPNNNEQDNPANGNQLFQFGLLGFLMPRFKCDDRYDLSRFKGGLSSLMDNWQWRDYNLDKDGRALKGNTARDERVWKKIKRYVDEIIDQEGDLAGKLQAGDPKIARDFIVGFPRLSPGSYSNTTTSRQYYLCQITVCDGWGSKGGNIKYRSDPPHSSYRLWWQRDPSAVYNENNKPNPGDVIEVHVGN